MAVREHDDGTPGRGALELGDEAVATGHHLVEALAAWTPVLEQLPSRMTFLDLGRGQALVLAVVVFDESVDHDRFDAGYGPASGLSRALQRAGEHHRLRAFRQRRQRGGSRSACRFPFSVNGRSVRPVCRPFSDHSVAP